MGVTVGVIQSSWSEILLEGTVSALPLGAVGIITINK